MFVRLTSSSSARCSYGLNILYLNSFWVCFSGVVVVVFKGAAFSLFSSSSRVYQGNSTHTGHVPILPLGITISFVATCAA